MNLRIVTWLVTLVPLPHGVNWSGDGYRVTGCLGVLCTSTSFSRQGGSFRPRSVYPRRLQVIKGYTGRVVKLLRLSCP